MILKVKIQQALAIAHIASDDGEFAFVLCRRGLQQLVGERFKTGETVLIEVEAKVKHENDD